MSGPFDSVRPGDYCLILTEKTPRLVRYEDSAHPYRKGHSLCGWISAEPLDDHPIWRQYMNTLEQKESNNGIVTISSPEMLEQYGMHLVTATPFLFVPINDKKTIKLRVELDPTLDAARAGSYSIEITGQDEHLHVDAPLPSRFTLTRDMAGMDIKVTLWDSSSEVRTLPLYVTVKNSDQVVVGTASLHVWVTDRLILECVRETNPWHFSYAAKDGGCYILKTNRLGKVPWVKSIVEPQTLLPPHFPLRAKGLKKISDWFGERGYSLGRMYCYFHVPELGGEEGGVSLAATNVRPASRPSSAQRQRTSSSGGLSQLLGENRSGSLSRSRNNSLGDGSGALSARGKSTPRNLAEAPLRVSSGVSTGGRASQSVELRATPIKQAMRTSSGNHAAAAAVEETSSPRIVAGGDVRTVRDIMAPALRALQGRLSDVERTAAQAQSEAASVREMVRALEHAIEANSLEDARARVKQALEMGGR